MLTPATEEGNRREPLIEQSRWPALARDRGLKVSVASVALGVLLIVLAYHQASDGQTSSGHFDVFWLGMALLWMPFAILCLRKAIDRRLRSVLLVAMGLAAYLPAFIRDPSSPMFNDEDGHYAQAGQILRNSRLFQSNRFLTMASKFPGLHVLTDALTTLSGLPLFRVATILLAFFHVMSVVGVSWIATQVLHDERAGLVAGLLYAISPAISFFDSEYAYESYAIPLCIWVIATALRGASRERGGSYLWFGVSGFLGICLDITHHLSAYEAIGFLLMLAVLRSIVRPGSQRVRLPSRPLWILGCFLGLVAWGWVALEHIPISGYLSVFPRQAWGSISHELFGTAQPAAPGAALAAQGSSRALFANSGIPKYEQYGSYLLQPLLLATALWSVSILRKRATADLVAVGVLAVVYFGTLPFLISAGGSSGVHRSWAFTWIGIAVLCPVAVLRFADKALGMQVQRRLLYSRRTMHSNQRNPRRSWMATRNVSFAVIALGVWVAQLGTYGGNVNSETMFPGPFVMESDGRTTTEQVTMAKWFAVHEGYGKTIVTDHRNLEVFVAYSDARPGAYPTWELFYPTGSPSASAIQRLYTDHIQYVVVDRRLATIPSTYLWFGNGQDIPPSDPLPAASIEKFSRLPYLRLIKQSQNLSIYAVRPPVVTNAKAKLKPSGSP